MYQKKHVRCYRKGETVRVMIRDRLQMRDIKRRYHKETPLSEIFSDNRVVLRRCYGAGGSTFILVNGVEISPASINATLEDFGVFNSGMAFIYIGVVSSNA